MLYQLCFYFLLFFIYSFCGWIIETITCSKNEKKLILNRGFLIGPYVPVYGTGALIMVVLLAEYKTNPLLFCMSMVYCSVLEYFTSVWMEYVYNARWWNYSDKKFNLNGRICLENSIGFGLLGVLLQYIVNPNVEFVLRLLSEKWLIAIGIILALIMIIDLFITMFVMSKLNIQVDKVRKDSTQDIDKQLKKTLKKYRIFYKRLFKAFPKFRFAKDAGGAILNNIREKLNEMEEYLNTKKEEIRAKRKEIKDLKNKKENGKIDKAKIKEVKTDIKQIKNKK